VTFCSTFDWDNIYVNYDVLFLAILVIFFAILSPPVIFKVLIIVCSYI
jgi:hypothetical protein